VVCEHLRRQILDVGNTYRMNGKNLSRIDIVYLSTNLREHCNTRMGLSNSLKSGNINEVHFSNPSNSIGKWIINL